MVEGFIKGKKERDLFENYLKNPSVDNFDKLNDAFKCHYLRIKTISYFSKFMVFEAKNYDKTSRRRNTRFSLVLDAPINGQGIMIDSIADHKTLFDEISLETWDESINHKEVRMIVQKLTNRQKEAIKYSYFYCMKDKEIAAKLGISPQAFSKNKLTALRKIRRALNLG